MNKEENSEKLVKICKLLGDDYSIKKLDGEQCIYRKLNDNYDIEISGLNNTKKEFKCTVFLWDISDHPRVVSTKRCESINKLESTLLTIERTYMK